METIHHHIPAAEPEATDANIPLVAWSTIGILGTLALCIFLAGLMFRYEESAMPKPTGIFSNLRRLPPPPRLQAFPAKDLAAFQAQQMSRVENYGWVDKQAGVAHVPVEKAMEMLLKSGLPVPVQKKAAAGAKPAAAAAKQ
ncbi:MAG: hypothetical protein IT165_08190 [Bryobacterales bacterium]|nr:hypothetical protein [Bryobacterales bacterium]